MSHVTLKLIDADGWVAPYPRQREAHNAWGFAPAVWGICAQSSAQSLDLRNLDPICAMFNSGRFDERLNLLLGATFDRVWVRREGFARLAESLRWFYETHLMRTGVVDTTVQMAQHLENLRYHPGLLGVGIDATSVNETWWVRRIPLGVDGLPLTGNGVRADYEYQPLNVLEHPLASDGQMHWELMAAVPSTP